MDGLLRWIAATRTRIPDWHAPAFLPGRTPRARCGADGVQEATIVVRQGYHPDRVRVRAGAPVRLRFRRDEDDPCSARLYLSEPRIERALAPFAWTTVGFTPRVPGNHLFTCEQGRFRGRLIVDPAPASDRHLGSAT